MENNLNSTKKDKWFLKWWGVIIILLSLLILLLGVYFLSLVFRFKKGIESGEIIVNNIVGGYSSFENNLDISQINVNRSELEDLNNPTLGSEDPIVTIVEFSDFNCPYSALFYPVLKDFVSEYPDKVKLIFRDFPLSGSEPALAANCAQEQDRFWEMHDKLFYNQENLSEDLIKRIADEMRLDMDLFNECYDQNKYEVDIQKDLTQGIKAGVEGTPTIFINGQRFPGVIPKNILEQILYAIEYGE